MTTFDTKLQKKTTTKMLTMNNYRFVMENVEYVTPLHGKGRSQSNQSDTKTQSHQKGVKDFLVSFVTKKKKDGCHFKTL